MRACSGLRIGFVLALLLFVPVARGDGFIENVGQYASEAHFVARARDVSIFLTPAGAVVDLYGAPPIGSGPSRDEDASLPWRSRDVRRDPPQAHVAVVLRFQGGAPAPRLEGLEPLPGRLRFLQRIAAGASAPEAQSFARVAYREVWPGIDVVWAVAADGAIDYEVVARTGADLSRVAFAWEGASVEPKIDGTHVVTTSLARIVDRGPVPGRPVGRLTFEQLRVIDTVPRTPPAAPDANDEGLRYSTFLGGNRDDEIHAVALDSAGRPVVVGLTRSTDFPTTLGVLEPAYAGSFDVFVSRFSADGSALDWSTYLGSTGDDRGWALRLDGVDRPIVAGVTAAPTFPVTAAAFDTTHNGSYDAFVAQLAADGSALVWSTFLGGSGFEFDVSALVLDAAGRPVVAGSTDSHDFPTTSGAWDETLGGTQDAFVTKLAADGASLVWSTLLGGSAADAAEDIALAVDGGLALVGRTTSTDFPVSPGAFQPARAGSGATEDAFVTRVAADGTTVLASTYLGGSANDEGYGIVVERDASTTVCGMTLSTDLPTTSGAAFPVVRGGGDAFVARIAADATSLTWSTYLGGSAGDRALDMATDWGMYPVVVGWTCAANFPVAGTPFDATYNGPCDAFAVRLQDDGGRLLYGSFIGGYDDESAFAVATDALGRLVVGGRTRSPDFPTSDGAWGTEHQSPEMWEDGFLTWLAPPAFCTTLTGALGPLLSVADWTSEACTPGAPLPQLLDIIEGRLEELSLAGIGDVWQIACDAQEATFVTATTPPPGFGLFQLARFAGGAYTDGGGPGLVGSRIPASGDCP